MAFHYGQAAIISIVLDQPSPQAIDKLRQKYNINMETVSELVGIYESLAMITYKTTERVNQHKTITSERSLLNKFTDGSSHLKLYPKVYFNLGNHQFSPFIRACKRCIQALINCRKHVD